jgi:hypothetical protein
MGYCVSLSECNFMIKAENQSKALVALKELFKDKHLMGVASHTIQKCRHLEVALEEIGYEATFDDDGHIVNLEFLCEKLSDELEVFNSIAPYVEENSYIEMYGEYGGMWRYIFIDGECKEIHPTISWE